VSNTGRIPRYYQTLPQCVELRQFESALGRLWTAGNLLETHSVSAEYSWEKSLDDSPIDKLGMFAVQSTFRPARGTSVQRDVPQNVLQMTIWKASEAHVFDAGKHKVPQHGLHDLVDAALGRMVVSEREWWSKAWEQVRAVDEEFVGFSAGNIIESSPRTIEHKTEYDIDHTFGDGTYILGRSRGVRVLHNGNQINSSCTEEVDVMGAHQRFRYERKFNGEVYMAIGSNAVDARQPESEQSWMQQFSYIVHAALNSDIAT
jgi:hypothetical protein